MTVEEYLRSLVFGLELPETVTTRAAYSPTEVGLAKLEPSDDAYPENPSDDFQVRLDYASSTIFYAVLGVFAGGGYTEAVGDVKVSRGGYTITMADRERFKMLADNLRKKHGFDVEDESSTGGAYDLTTMRH